LLLLAVRQRRRHLGRQQLLRPLYREQFVIRLAIMPAARTVISSFTATVLMENTSKLIAPERRESGSSGANATEGAE